MLHHETKQRDNESSTIEVKAMMSKHQASRKGLKCHHCGRFGHIKRECRMLLKSPGKNQDNRTRSYSNKKPLRKHKAYAAEEMTKERRLLVWLLKLLYLLAEETTRLLILVRLVT